MARHAQPVHESKADVHLYQLWDWTLCTKIKLSRSNQSNLSQSLPHRTSWHPTSPRLTCKAGSSPVTSPVKLAPCFTLPHLSPSWLA
eukprot:1156507-Pelagomonas_calceolata.AAC.3